MNQGFYAIGGLLIGVLIGWLLRTVKRMPPDTRVEEELRQQRAAQSSELAKTQTDLREATNKCAAFEALNGTLTEQLKTEREQISEMQTKMERDFEAVANKLLLGSSEKFSGQ